MLVGFDPASGHEQQGAGRPALVLSVQAFNQLGMTLVAPITQGGNFARYAGFSVPLHCEEGDVHARRGAGESGADDGSTRPAGKAYWSGCG